jgi:hypothetical protein
MLLRSLLHGYGHNLIRGLTQYLGYMGGKLANPPPGVANPFLDPGWTALNFIVGKTWIEVFPEDRDADFCVRTWYDGYLYLKWD